MSLNDYLSQLAEQGRHDSRGAFTVGLAQAREKLLDHRATEPDAYLCLLASAGLGYGGRAVTIHETRSMIELSTPDAYFPQEDLLRGIDSVVTQKGDNDTLDLVLGLYGALRRDIMQIRVLVRDARRPCYEMRLTRTGEEFHPLTEACDRSSIEIALTREEEGGPRRSWLTRAQEKLFGAPGYVGMGPACRVVDSRAELSHHPISINRQMVNRPLYLPRCPVAAQLGKVTGVHFQSAQVLRRAQSGWNAAVALQPGALRCVVNGIVYPAIPHPDLTGVIWTHRLRRDISREQVVRDAEFETLLAELAEVQEEMERVEETL